MTRWPNLQLSRRIRAREQEREFDAMMNRLIADAFMVAPVESHLPETRPLS
jgi:hypothetical protein